MTILDPAAPPAPALTPAELVAHAAEAELDGRPLAALARELGAAAAANRLVPHVLLPALLADAPAGVVTTALGEGDEDFDLDAVDCRLAGDRLTGRKPLVSGALDCERALVAARADGGVVLALVALDGAGVTRRPLRTLGRGGDADVVFDAAPVEAVFDVRERLPHALRLATLAQAAEGAGILHRLLELSLEQGHARHAFGRPIGSFMAFQHACADMAMERELADTAVDRAAVTGAELDAVRARVFVAGAAVRAARAGLQLQGGQGFLDDSPVARLYRQAKESQLRWGAPGRQAARLAHALLEA